MLVESYVEALCADEILADLVWDLWDRGDIDDFEAHWFWLLIASGGNTTAITVASLTGNLGPNIQALIDIIQFQ